jgi:Fe2+ or Zn2+ uptake regulation protein
MFFIWGVGNARKYTNVFVKETCDRCGTTQNINVIMEYSYGSIFFIPVIKLRKKYFVVCQRCGSFKEISKREFKAIKQSNRNGLVYGETEVVVKSEPVKAIENKEPKNEIYSEIEKLIAQLKERNYVLTAEKLPRFKVVLKEQLLMKFENEQQVDLTIEEYFKDNNF